METGTTETYCADFQTGLIQTMQEKQLQFSSWNNKPPGLIVIYTHRLSICKRCTHKEHGENEDCGWVDVHDNTGDMPKFSETMPYFIINF